MLNITNMTKGDAIHNLNVLQWLLEHRDEIEAIAVRPVSNDEVSAEDAQERFHEVYTELASTRFLAVEIHILTDEDSLARDSIAEPNVIIYTDPEHEEWITPDYFNTPMLRKVAKPFCIGAHERTWKLIEK